MIPESMESEEFHQMDIECAVNLGVCAPQDCNFWTVSRRPVDCAQESFERIITSVRKGWRSVAGGGISSRPEKRVQDSYHSEEERRRTMSDPPLISQTPPQVGEW